MLQVTMGDRHMGTEKVAFSTTSFPSILHNDGLCFQRSLWALRIGGLRRERVLYEAWERDFRNFYSSGQKSQVYLREFAFNSTTLLL